MPVELFFPDTIRLAARAYEEAVRTLPPSTPEDVKNILARRILGTASLGARDPVEMREDGLAYISS